MMEFAHTGSRPEPGRLCGTAPRTISVIVTALVHVLGVGMIVQGQFHVPSKGRPAAADPVILVHHTRDTPEKPKQRPRAAASDATDPRDSAPPVPLPAPQPLPVVLPQDMVVPPVDIVASEAPPSPEAVHRPRSDVVEDYRHALFDKLAAQRHYPEAARLRHYQGAGALLFRIDREGRLLDAAMEQSTGQAVLDRAALKQVRRAAPFPRIPEELPDELAVSLPLRFMILQPGRQIAVR